MKIEWNVLALSLLKHKWIAKIYFEHLLQWYYSLVSSIELCFVRLKVKNLKEIVFDNSFHGELNEYNYYMLSNFKYVDDVIANRSHPIVTLYRGGSDCEGMSRFHEFNLLERYDECFRVYLLKDNGGWHVVNFFRNYNEKYVMYSNNLRYDLKKDFEEFIEEYYRAIYYYVMKIK